MPIMTKSRACHLSGLTRAALVALKEEANEMGGYFICNGLERIIRCIIAQRRHYIMALKRGVSVCWGAPPAAPSRSAVRAAASWPS